VSASSLSLSFLFQSSFAKSSEGNVPGADKSCNQVKDLLICKISVKTIIHIGSNYGEAGIKPGDTERLPGIWQDHFKLLLNDLLIDRYEIFILTLRLWP
jgi:hypothetical protein